jgi:hypothetical protein
MLAHYGDVAALPTDVLTDAEVDRLASGLVIAASDAAAKIRAGTWRVTKLLGWIDSDLFPNADVQEKTAGALDMIWAQQIPRWRTDGHNKVAVWNADPSSWSARAERNWREAGLEFADAIGDVGTYAADAALSKSLWDTGASIPGGLADKFKDGLSLVPWYVWVGLAGGGALYLYLRFGRKS